MDNEVIQFFGTFAVIFFLVVFLGIVIYAFLPSNSGKFNNASRIPLDNEDL